jgi:hypothetical protein
MTWLTIVEEETKLAQQVVSAHHIRMAHGFLFYSRVVVVHLEIVLQHRRLELHLLAWFERWHAKVGA